MILTHRLRHQADYRRAQPRSRPHRSFDQARAHRVNGAFLRLPVSAPIWPLCAADAINFYQRNEIQIRRSGVLGGEPAIELWMLS